MRAVRDQKGGRKNKKEQPKESDPLENGIFYL